jgi:hypothetical protein
MSEPSHAYPKGVELRLEQMTAARAVDLLERRRDTLEVHGQDSLQAVIDALNHWIDDLEAHARG